MCSHFMHREKIPFISTVIHSKLVMRAVCLKDLKLLESYVKDTAHVSEVTIMITIAKDGEGHHLHRSLQSYFLANLLI